MKRKKHIPQLTLELYYQGLATFTERRQVAKALKTDSETRKRYEALQQSHQEVSEFVKQELSRKQIPAPPPIPFPRKRKAVIGLIVAAAVLLCAIIPTILYLKSSNANSGNVITEETTPEIEITEDEPDHIADIPDSQITPPTEPPAATEKGNTNNKATNKPVIAETPQAEPFTIDPNSGISIAEAPSTDTGIRLRGESQQGATSEPEPTPNINIPPGITFIFENMFANKDLSFVIIPSRITSIGKNAFSGNPLLSVTIGANVSIEDTAIPGNFAAFYNANGKAAGTYTRPGTDSEVWEKK